MTPSVQTATQNPSLERLLARLVETIGPVRCNLWFEEPGRIIARRDAIHFLFESEFEANRVQRNFGLIIRSCVSAIYGAGVRVQFDKLTMPGIECEPTNQVEIHSPLVTGTQPAAKVKLEPANDETSQGGSIAINDSKTKPFRDRTGPLGLVSRKAGAATSRRKFEPSGAHEPAPHTRNPGTTLPTQATQSSKSLERFWFGSENELVQAAINQSIQQPGSFSPLLIFGPTGTGKSHLLEGVNSVFRNKLGLKRCVFLTAEEFTNSFVQALRGSGLPLFRKKFRDLDLLAIDDIQFLAGKRATVTELQYTLDQLSRLGKQVVLSADRSPSELAQLSNELAARIAGGLNCPIRFPDLAGRRQIVAWMCEQRGFSLSPEIVNVLASGVTRDCRKLSGALNRLRAVMLSTGQPPTAESTRRDLADLLSDPRPATTLIRIEQVICEACGVTSPELRSESRSKRVSSARMLAMWLSRQYTTNALSEIGEYFGGRSHSTVVSAQKRVDQWLQSEQQIEINSARYPLRDAVQIISRKLRVG